MNTCPKKSETVYQPIWAILKLFGKLNNKILKLSIRGIPRVPKLYITSKKSEWEVNISETVCPQKDRNGFLFTPVTNVNKPDVITSWSYADNKSKEMRHKEEAGGHHQTEELLQKGA